MAKGYALIHSDTPNWDPDEFLFFPQFILGRNCELIPVMCGKPSMELLNDEKGTYGIYVSIEDEDLVDYNQALIFFHNSREDIPDELVESVVEMTKDSAAVNTHIHVSKFKQSAIIEEGDDEDDED